MKIFYSPSLRGFFSPDVHTELPADARPVTARRHAELLAAQEKGATIVPGRNGAPDLQWPDARAALMRSIKAEAGRRIRLTSPPWRQMNDLREPSEAGARRFAMIDAIRAASAEIERMAADASDAELGRFPVRNHPLWPEADNG